MNDLIDRQAAINTVSNWLRAVFGVNSNANTIGVFRELRALPSAETTQTNNSNVLTNASNALNALDCISRQAAIDAVHKSIFDFFDICDDDEESPMTHKDEVLLEINKAITTQIKDLPSAEPEIIRCKDCQYQEKFFHKDARRKGGGYYIYGCELSEEYSHVCLDDDFCSRAERRIENADVNT